MSYKMGYSHFMNPRIVIHVDMNAYFASIEQKANPLLRGKPLLVVADSKRRSVVMTSSYEARKFGVKTGMNLWEARKLCPHAIAVDGNSDKYLDSTRKILQVLESFSNQVEMSSCDEAYLDVTGSLKCFSTDGAGIGMLLKNKVKAATGLPCSVGVTPNKLLSKLASERKKPDGLTVILPEEVTGFLAEIPVEDLCGIGSRLKEKLNGLGVKNCRQLGEMDQGFMENYFGVWGYWLKRMGQGKDDSPVKDIQFQEDAKSVGHSMTFPKDTPSDDLIKSYLLLLCEKVACRMREHHYQGRTVSLYVRYKDFSGAGKQKAVKSPLDDGYEIYRTALNILDQFRPLREPVRLLGVSVSSLVKTQWQEYLFQAMAKRRDALGVNDEINRKFGAFTLKPAILLQAQKHGILEAPIPPSMRGRL